MLIRVNLLFPRFSDCLNQTFTLAYSPLLAQALQFHSMELGDFLKSFMVPRGDCLLSMCRLHSILTTASKFINQLSFFKTLPESTYTYTRYHWVKLPVLLIPRVKGISTRDWLSYELGPWVRGLFMHLGRSWVDHLRHRLSPHHTSPILLSPFFIGDALSSSRFFFLLLLQGLPRRMPLAI